MKVNLKVKNGETTETQQHEIEEVNIIQVTSAIKIIKEILESARDNENIEQILDDLFNEAQENLDMEAAEFGMRMLRKALGALDTLFVEVPEKTIELLSVLSGIEYDILIQQKAVDAFDIYDSVIEVNDMEKLIKRAKKSLALTKAQKKVIELFQNKQEQGA